MYPRGTICYQRGITAPRLQENNGRMVQVLGSTTDGLAWVQALQTVLGCSGLTKGIYTLPPGAVLCSEWGHLVPLGDKGVEEATIFGIPSPADFSQKGWAR